MISAKWPSPGLACCGISRAEPGDGHPEKKPLAFSGLFQRTVYRLGMVMRICQQWPISEEMENFGGGWWWEGRADEEMSTREAISGSSLGMVLPTPAACLVPWPPPWHTMPLQPSDLLRATPLQIIFSRTFPELPRLQEAALLLPSLTLPAHPQHRVDTTVTLPSVSLSCPLPADSPRLS